MKCGGKNFEKHNKSSKGIEAAKKHKQKNFPSIVELCVYGILCVQGSMGRVLYWYIVQKKCAMMCQLNTLNDSPVSPKNYVICVHRLVLY